LPIEYVRLSTIPPDTPGRDKLIEDFFAELKKAGITEIREGRALDDSERAMKEGRLYL